MRPMGSWGWISVVEDDLGGPQLAGVNMDGRSFKREGRLVVGASQSSSSCNAFGDALNKSAAILGKQGMKE